MAVGGKAVPGWPDRRPDHLVPELDWVVGCTYQGMPVDTADVRNAMGCNMSMRRTVFDVAGTFDESIGRIGKIPLGCDETELCIRLAQKIPGARVVYEPRALVHHRVTEPRTTWHYLRTRSYAEGLSKALIGRLVGNADATSVERSYVSHTLTAAVRRELGQGLRGRASGWRGAAGIVLALTATGWGYVVGRLQPATAPGERRRVHEDPPPGAVLPAGGRRRGAARPQPGDRAGRAVATRCTSPASTSASRRRWTRASPCTRCPTWASRCRRSTRPPTGPWRCRSRTPTSSRALSRLVDRSGPDVVHAHNWIINSYLPLAAARRLPLVYSLHDYSHVCPTKRLMFEGAPCSGPGLKKCFTCTTDWYGAGRGPVIQSMVRTGRPVRNRVVDVFTPVSTFVGHANELDEQGVRWQVVPNFVPDALLSTGDVPRDPVLPDG